MEQTQTQVIGDDGDFWEDPTGRDMIGPKSIKHDPARQWPVAARQPL